MADGVTVFIDAQNMYQGARRAFFQPHDSHPRGRFRPDALGRLIVASGPPDVARVLNESRVYSGRPDATRQPKSYAAHLKQCSAWTASGVRLITRPLRYPFGWHKRKPRKRVSTS